MKWFSWLWQLLDPASKLLQGDRFVEIPGAPFSYRVILHPNLLFEALARKRMERKVDNILLELGPIDNILGRYKLQDKTITVDVLEIALRKVKDPSPESLDREVTRVLAHEIRHQWQRETLGPFRMLWDKIAMFLCFLTIGWIVFVTPATRIAAHLITTPGWWHIPVAGLTLYATYVLVRLVISLSSVFAYRWCWCERDANRFADEIADDPDWQKAIDVDVALNLPEELRQKLGSFS